MITISSCSQDIEPPCVGCGGGPTTKDIEVYDNTALRTMAATEVAPNMTKVLIDDYDVLMYELTIEPGDTLPHHEHAINSYYIIQGGTLEIIFNDSTSETIEFETGDTGIGAPSGDMAINRGETTIKVLMQEFYYLEVKANKSNYDVKRTEGAFYVAPNMTKVKHDEYGIVVYELVISPGETLPYHTHPWHSHYVIEGGSLEVIFGNASSGNISEYLEGSVAFGKPNADVAINRGETTMKVLLYELYSLKPEF